MIEKRSQNQEMVLIEVRTFDRLYMKRADIYFLSYNQSALIDGWLLKALYAGNAVHALHALPGLTLIGLRSRASYKKTDQLKPELFSLIKFASLPAAVKTDIRHCYLCQKSLVSAAALLFSCFYSVSVVPG